MLFMLDNYDSFTYNLVQYFQELGQEVVIRRNDQTTLAEIEALQPDYLCISAGPGRPEDAGLALDCIRHFAGQLPILGVCLGHQAIAAAYGGKIIRAQQAMHGKVAPINHQQKGIFKGLPNPFNTTLYHSLVVDKKDFPDELEIIAQTDNGEIMGLRHKKLALNGVQFHPESIFSEYGHELLQNFLDTQETQ